MKQFIQITRYEFSMSIRRPGYWIAYSLLGLFYLGSALMPSPDGSSNIIPPEQIRSAAGNQVFMFNIFMPLLAGILAADRMQRDFRTGVNELQRSTPLSNASYILAKYLGALAVALLPIFTITMVSGIAMVITGIAPFGFLKPLLLAFLTIAVPAHAFVVAFSLACPLVMPLRVYQVLFTGYWFWGNMLNPKAFPTISETLLNAVGQYPLQAYFLSSGHTPPEATLNLLVLIACIATALFAINYYLHWQAKRA